MKAIKPALPVPQPRTVARPAVADASKTEKRGPAQVVVQPRGPVAVPKAPKYFPPKGYKPGGPYDPKVVESERVKRNQAALNYESPTAEKAKARESGWKPGTPASRNQGAMIRTGTYDPRLAVMREKIQGLRKAKAKREAGKG